MGRLVGLWPSEFKKKLKRYIPVKGIYRRKAKIVEIEYVLQFVATGWKQTVEIFHNY